MKRREFITLLVGAAATWPVVARGQQSAMPKVGYLRSGEASSTTIFHTAVLRGLKEAGFVEGQNFLIEYRWSDDHSDRLPSLASELVKLPVDVIVANQPAAQAAKAVTSVVPIVFVTGADPVRAGLVASINRPGGNVTGIVFTVGDLTAKRLGLLRELVPGASAIAVLADPNSPAFEQLMSGAAEAGRTLGLRIEVALVSQEQELESAFATITRAGAGGLLVGGGGFFATQQKRIIELALRHRLPASYATRFFSDAGGLMSYGPNQADAYRQAGHYAARILNGTKPQELPVDQAAKFELVINLKTAKALGLTVPNSMQLLSDDVIE
jgi:putative ABC transport system substrate-binding protein